MNNIFMTDPKNIGTFFHTCLRSARLHMLPNDVEKTVLELSFQGTPFNELRTPPKVALMAISGYKFGIIKNKISQLPAELLDSIASGQCRLVIDYAHENGNQDLLNEVITEAERLGWNHKETVAIILQNRQVRSHDHRVVVFYYDSFIVSACMEIVQSWRNLEDMLAALDITRCLITDHNSKKILCLNATPRRHRILTLLLLEECGLISFSRSITSNSMSVFSFPGLEYTKKNEGSLSEMQKWLEIHGYSRLCNKLSQLVGEAPYHADTTRQKGNQLANSIPIGLYAETDLSVVTETAIDRFSTRITEKTFKAAAMGHPYVIIGHAGSLQIMRELGFATFEHCICPEYDKEIDPVLRIAKSVRSAKDFISGLQKKSIRMGDLIDQRLFNVKWARSGFIGFYHSSYTAKIIEFVDSQGKTN